MVMACCNHGTKKYIHANGAIDYTRLAAALSEDSELSVPVDPAELREADDQGIIRYCKCDCHKDGEDVLH
jgi:hypothetical protein